MPDKILEPGSSPCGFWRLGSRFLCCEHKGGIRDGIHARTPFGQGVPLSSLVRCITQLLQSVAACTTRSEIGLRSTMQVAQWALPSSRCPLPQRPSHVSRSRRFRAPPLPQDTAMGSYCRAGILLLCHCASIIRAVDQSSSDFCCNCIKAGPLFVLLVD